MGLRVASIGWARRLGGTARRDAVTRGRHGADRRPSTCSAGGSSGCSQGAFDAVTDYGDDPVAVARRWEEEGATRLHVVDLDAARDGQAACRRPSSLGIVRRGVPCQVAGGIRDARSGRRHASPLGLTASSWAARSSASLRSRPGSSSDTVRGRIVAALDVRDGQAARRRLGTGRPRHRCRRLARSLAEAGVHWFAVTAIARDGGMQRTRPRPPGARPGGGPGLRHHRLGRHRQPGRHRGPGEGGLRGGHRGPRPVRGRVQPARGDRGGRATPPTEGRAAARCRIRPDVKRGDHGHRSTADHPAARDPGRVATSPDAPPRPAAVGRSILVRLGLVGLDDLLGHVRRHLLVLRQRRAERARDRR